MAIFGKKKTTEEKVENVEEVKKTKTTKKTTKTKAVKVEKSVAAKEETKVEVKSEYGYRITEKATRLADKNVYVLNVPKNINKTQLKNDLEKKYKVTVLNINIVNSPKKDKFYRGKWGTRGGGKKAYITLKAGDSIVL